MARWRPVGGSIGAWRSAHGTYWFVKGAEQLFVVCLEWAWPTTTGVQSMRPGEARGKSPSGVVVIPAETSLGACFCLLSAEKRAKPLQKHRKQRGCCTGPALRALVRVKPGSDPGPAATIKRLAAASWPHAIWDCRCLIKTQLQLRLSLR